MSVHYERIDVHSPNAFTKTKPHDSILIPATTTRKYYKLCAVLLFFCFVQALLWFVFVIPELVVPVSNCRTTQNMESIPQFVTQNGTDESIRIRVLLYHGPGASPYSVKNIQRLLSCNQLENNIEVVTFKHFHSLRRISHRSESVPDVLIVPGGFQSGFLNDGAGLKLVTPSLRKLIANLGMGYIGICAGAFQALDNKYGFKLSRFKVRSGALGIGVYNSTVIDQETWQSLGETGELHSLFHNQEMSYANGPLFGDRLLKQNVKTRFVTGSQVLLRMSTNSRLKIFRKATKRHLERLATDSSPVVVTNLFGKGRVILSSGHPEHTMLGVKFSSTQCASPMSLFFTKLVRLAAANSSRLATISKYQ